MAVVGPTMPDAMIPITERFLSEAGGWQALKEARGMHAAGRVLAATYAPPLLEGRVREGQGELKTGLRILGPSKVENLCSCRTARRDGMICAHALAVGLEWLKPRPAAVAAPVPVVESGPRFAEEGEPMELQVVLPGNFAVAWERGQVTIGAEAVLAGRRVLLSALDPAKTYACAAADYPVLAKLRTLAGGGLPGVFTLDRPGFLELLPALTTHPQVTFAKTTPVTVSNTPFRPPAALPPSAALPATALLLASATQAWILEGTLFCPLAIDPPAADAPPPPGTPPPRFALALEGSLNHLTARLDAIYGDRTYTVEATPPRTTGTFARHHPAERAALDRLQTAGFTPPDRTGQLVLKGEQGILAFFASVLPRLEKEWEVTIGERFTHVTKDIERIQPLFEFRTSGENWFDLQIELATPGGERFSATEIQRLLQSGQSATRLKNRKLAVFDTGLLNEFQEALTDCNPQQRQPGTYRISKVHAPYLGLLAHEAQEQGGALRADAAWQTCADFTNDASTALPLDLGKLATTLRPYQIDGVTWLNKLRINGLNGLLADEMGLGKTVQTLAFLRGVSGPKLVVCPSSLVFNWEREAQHFTPELRTLAIQGGDRHAALQSGFANVDLLITSYALLRRDIAHYASIRFAAVVLDEAQHIKNPESQSAQTVCLLKADFRLALTGTPVENTLTDIWSVMNFLLPGYLGTKREFRERYENEINRAPNGPIHQRLVRRMRPFILRRLKRDVIAELPDKLTQVTYCELNKEQSVVYSDLVEGTRRMASEWAATQNQGKVRMLMLTALLRLRQACCDLRLLNPQKEPEFREPSGKLQVLEELLLEAVDGGHRVLLFSQFTTMLNLLHQTLDGLGLEYCHLDGQTKDRGAEVDRFQKGNAPVFLISLKAGGTGLNLTAADTVIHFDPWWNPAVENQATDRAHRIGQKSVVTSYKLITRGTVEEKILALQNRKREVIDATLDGGEPPFGGLDTEDLRELLS